MACTLSASSKMVLPRAQALWSYMQNNKPSIASIELEYDNFNESMLPEVYRNLEAKDVFAAEHPCGDIVLALFHLGSGGLMSKSHNVAEKFTSTLSNATQKCDDHWQSIALWLHGICHRREGSYEGPFGDGWSNSSFWFSQVRGPLPGVDQKLSKYAGELGRKLTEQQSPVGIGKITNHLSELLKGTEGNTSGGMWDHDAFIACVRQANEIKEPTLIDYCEHVQQYEVLLLLNACYSLM